MNPTTIGSRPQRLDMYSKLCYYINSREILRFQCEIRSVITYFVAI